MAKSESRHRSLIQKLVETGFLSATWFGLGLYLEIFGPTLIDLKIKTNSNYEDVSVAVSGRSVGLFIGAVVGGVMVDKFGWCCHLWIAISLDIAAISTVVAPWSPGTEILWVCCTVGGAVETIINIAGQRLIFNLWKEKSAGPMHFLHMGYGIGSFIVPLYSNPFLAIPIPSATTANVTNASMEPQTDNLFSNVSTEKSHFMQTAEHPKAYLRESHIEYAYAISACLVALLSVVFYYYQIEECRIYKKARLGTNKEELHELNDDKQKQKSDGITSRSFREMFNPGSCSGGRTWYAIQLLIFLFLYFGNLNGGERLIGGFIRSFSVDHLGFDTYDASYLNTSFWISFTVGRFTFFTAARWIGIRKLVIIETCGVTITAILMNIFAANNPVAYWVLIQPLGFFESPMWPSMMAWSDYHIELTGVGMTVMLFAGGIGGICHLRLIGYLYEHKGPRTFLYQVLGFGILALTLAIILTIIGAQHGSRFKWDRDTSVQVNNEPVQTELLIHTSENADNVKEQKSSDDEEI